MGAVCSCFGLNHPEDQANDRSPVHMFCMPLRSFTQQFVHSYNSLLRRGEVHPLPSSMNGTTPTATFLVDDDSISDTYRSPPRPLPFDDPRCSGVPCSGLISRGNKFSSRCHEESEPLRPSMNDTTVEPASGNGKLSTPKYERGSKLSCCESLKNSSEQDASVVTYTFPSSEDEDVCPTCLEEYTSDNPRIVMQCSHHYHLSCIYEWMERSNACPVCGKLIPVTVFEDVNIAVAELKKPSDDIQ